MNRKLIRLTIIAAICLELFWALTPRLELSRSSETARAAHAYQTNPTAATRAALLDRMRRDANRYEQQCGILLGLMLVADLMAIYFFWNYRMRRPSL
jgi:hypothetical protein